MARIARADATRDRNSGGATLQELIATLASATNPDGTTFALPAEPRPTAPTTRIGARVAAPAAAAVIADTGALAAGDYSFQITLSYADTLAAGKGLVVEHRDAANTATVRPLGGVPAGDSREFVIPRYTLAANESIRVVNDGVAGAAGSAAIAAILATPF